ncbi:MAG: hypothetical protein R3Y46_06575 [Opitutales bacterium]
MTKETKQILEGTELSLTDAANIVKGILDARPKKSKLDDAQFCAKIIALGFKNLHSKEMTVAKGFATYMKTKEHLSEHSFRDMNYLGGRLLKSSEKFAQTNFSELSGADCDKWISNTFSTVAQFNKAHTFLHGLFAYAIRQDWLDKNVIKLVKKKEPGAKMKLCGKRKKRNPRARG